MLRTDWTLKAILLLIALFLGCIALRPLVDPPATVLAQGGKFDYVYVISAGYLYKGSQGALLLDKRNGNMWFLPRTIDSYQNPIFGDPTFIVRVPLEKLDQNPPQQ